MTPLEIWLLHCSNRTRKIPEILIAHGAKVELLSPGAQEMLHTYYQSSTLTYTNFKEYIPAKSYQEKNKQEAFAALVKFIKDELEDYFTRGRYCNETNEHEFQEKIEITMLGKDFFMDLDYYAKQTSPLVNTYLNTSYFPPEAIFADIWDKLPAEPDISNKTDMLELTAKLTSEEEEIVSIPFSYRNQLTAQGYNFAHYLCWLEFDKKAAVVKYFIEQKPGFDNLLKHKIKNNLSPAAIILYKIYRSIPDYINLSEAKKETETYIEDRQDLKTENQIDIDCLQLLKEKGFLSEEESLAYQEVLDFILDAETDDANEIAIKKIKVT